MLYTSGTTGRPKGVMLSNTNLLAYFEAARTGFPIPTPAVHLIVLPLFWDQYENAQRIDELGLGIRLDTYRFADEELTGAVDRLLADTALRDRLAAIGAAIRARDGLRIGADVIERVGREYRGG